MSTRTFWFSVWFVIGMSYIAASIGGSKFAAIMAFVSGYMACKESRP